jgi:hypothetical protein
MSVEEGGKGRSDWDLVLCRRGGGGGLGSTSVILHSDLGN